MRLSKMKTTCDFSISIRSELYPKQVVVIEYVESTDLSNIYYKKHKAVLEITTDTEWSYHDNPHKSGSFSDQRLTDALASFEQIEGTNKAVDYTFNVEETEVCEATNVEEYFKMLEDSGWKRDEDILKPTWQIRAEKAGWTAPVKED